jgi:taurine dioxygenase
MKLENRYMHRWTEGDLAIWDNLRTLHHAIFDYGKDEIRSMWRCQVRGEKVFDPAFIKSALAGAQATA